MKELKDYLHLYLGCDLEIHGSKYEKWKLTAVQSNSKLIVARNNIDSREGHFFSPNEIKPILRPLSDMTEDEKKLVGGLWRESKIGYQMETEISADKTRYLLSKSFDLFGLIESGLAINKSTIKTTTI